MEYDGNVDVEELLKQADEKVELGKCLNESLNKFQLIPGVQKLQRKILQEIKFLNKVVQKKQLKPDHVKCSNLTHYAFLIEILQRQRGIVHVDCAFVFENRSNPLRVDIVCNDGLTWIKAVARNWKSLAESARGEVSYGSRSILDQAREFVAASEQHPCVFQQPKVMFYFSQLQDSNLSEELKAIGVETASLTNSSSSSTNVPQEEISNTATSNKTLNLDITTMLALISNLTNGSCNWSFREPILSEQAEKERESSIQPALGELFAGNHLICCKTACESFRDIVSLLAGPLERERAERLLQTVQVLPDVDIITEQLANIRLTAKINKRSLKIFAFGMQMRALTVTSNSSFVRAAKMQGIEIPAYIHQARALTEMKETTATKLIL